MEERFRILLDHFNMKQNQMAKDLMITESYMSRLLNGINSNKISDTLLLLISRTYGVRYEWLKYGEGDMFISCQPDSYAESEYIKNIISIVSKFKPESKILVKNILEQMLKIDDK